MVEHLVSFEEFFFSDYKRKITAMRFKMMDIEFSFSQSNLPKGLYIGAELYNKVLLATMLNRSTLMLK